MRGRGKGCRFTNFLSPQCGAFSRDLLEEKSKLLEEKSKSKLFPGAGVHGYK